MKQKNKNFFKCLGIGALACFGMLTMSGCSFIQITEQEFDRIMESIQTVEDSIDLSDAIKYYNKAIMKSMNMEGQFWNDMKLNTVVSYMDGEEEIFENSETYFIRTELDQQIYFNKNIVKPSSVETNSYNIITADTEGILSIVKNQDIYEKTNHNGYLIDFILNNDVLINDLYFGRKVDGKFEFFKNSDILKAELNENYNYVVTIMFKEYKSDLGNVNFTTYEIQNEINQDSEFVSQTITITTFEHGITSIRTILNVFEYGQVEFSDIEEEYEALLDYQNPTT